MLTVTPVPTLACGLLKYTRTKERERKAKHAMLKITKWGRWRHVDPWGFLSSQPNLLGKFWSTKRPCLKKKKIER